MDVGVAVVIVLIAISALFHVQVTADSRITKIPLLLAVGDKDSLIGSR